MDRALTFHNKNRLLDKPQYNKVYYYRQSIFQRGSPKDQRVEPPLILPKKDYFINVRSNEVKTLLTMLNDDLNRVKQLKADIESGETIREISFDLHNIIYVCTIISHYQTVMQYCTSSDESSVHSN